MTETTINPSANVSAIGVPAVIPGSAADLAAAAGGGIRERLLAGIFRVPTVVMGVFAAVLIAMIWVSVMLQIGSDRTRQLGDTLRDSANLVRTFEEHTVRTIKNVDQAVLFVKYQYEQLGQNIDIAGYLSKGIINGRIFNQIGVIDEHGMYIMSSLPDFKPMDLSDREHFKVHVRGRFGRAVCE